MSQTLQTQVETHTIPCSTKLTACLSAWFRRLQSAEWMWGRERRLPIMDLTKPKASIRKNTHSNLYTHSALLYSVTHSHTDSLRITHASAFRGKSDNRSSFTHKPLLEKSEVSQWTHSENLFPRSTETPGAQSYGAQRENTACIRVTVFRNVCGLVWACRMNR